MMIPLIKYCVTKKEKYIKQTAMHMAVTKESLDKDTMDTIKDSFDNVKTKVGMPSNISSKLIKNYTSHTLVIASEKDCLFPAKKVLPRAKEIFADCETSQLKGCGHIHILAQEEKEHIINFLQRQL